MKHSPIPWHLGKDKFGGMTYVKSTLNNQRVVQTLSTPQTKTKEMREANAAHIVKCVNMHDELVKAVRLAATTFDDLDVNSETDMKGFGIPAICTELGKLLEKAKGEE